MTEAGKPKLGQDPGLLVDILGFGLAAEVDLLPGEVPLCAWDAFWWRGGWGILYLTSQRLVWIRWRASLPRIAKVAVIPLHYVECVEAKRNFWSVLLLSQTRAWGRQVVVDLKGGERYVFSPASHGPDARSIVTEITSILRERGLLRD